MPDLLTPPDHDPVGVLTSALPVVLESSLVRLVPERLDAVVDTLLTPTDLPTWDVTYHYVGDPESTAQYVFVLDTLNYCFWGEPRWQVECAGAWINGYYALALALKMAIERGEPVLSADWMATVTPAQLATTLGGRHPLPLLTERAAGLNEAGGLLLSRYGGRFAAMVDAAAGSAPGLVRLLANQLQSYRDVSTWQGRQVWFLKRAQICASDLASALGGASGLRDLDLLTAFADYKVPQVLRALGVIEYAEPLATRVDGRLSILSGSEAELAIRAATVWAVECIRRIAGCRGISVTARDLDWRLWLLGQSSDLPLKPYHLTRTIFY